MQMQNNIYGVRNDAIVCDTCCKWYHRQCLPNMTKGDLNKISKMLPNMWTCPNCINEIFPLGLTNLNIIELPISDIKTNNKGASARCLPQLNSYPKVKFGNLDIERVTNIKFLGVIINDTFKWNDHLSYIISKINKNIGYFYRARHILGQEQLINLYNSFVEPYITYCLPIWGGYINLDSPTNPLTKTINRLKRIMTFSKRTHTADNRITLMTLRQYYQLEMTKTAHMHISHPETSPTIYHNIMTRIPDRHSYNGNISTQLTENETSTRLNLAIPRFNNNYKKHSFRYQIGKIWNSLPYPVKLKDSKNTFIGAMRRFMCT